jgi:hypothetical protein
MKSHKDSTYQMETLTKKDSLKWIIKNSKKPPTIIEIKMMMFSQKVKDTREIKITHKANIKRIKFGMMISKPKSSN